MKRLKAVGTAVAAASAPLPAFAQASVDRPTYWHSGWDWGWGHMFFGSLMMILFWGGLILVILLAVRWLGGGTSHGAGSPSVRRPLDILQERFARGETAVDLYE